MQGSLKIDLRNGVIDGAAITKVVTAFRGIAAKGLAVDIPGEATAHRYFNVMVECYKSGRFDDVLMLWTCLRRSRSPVMDRFLDANAHFFERAYFEHCVRRRAQEWRDAFLEEHLDLTPGSVPDGAAAPVVICASPRSGSTYLGMMLSMYLDRPHVSAHGRNAVDPGVHVDFDVHTWRTMLRDGAVIQTHIVPGLPFLSMLHALGIRPIVVFRNIFEVLTSKANRTRAAYADNLFGLGRGMTAEDSLRFTADRYAVRIFEFAHAWQRAADMVDCRIYDFRDIKGRWLEALESMVRYLGHTWDPAKGGRVVDDLDDLSNRNPTSFNRMTSASKEAMPAMSEETKREIRRISAAFDERAVRRLVSDEFAV